MGIKSSAYLEPHHKNYGKFLISDHVTQQIKSSSNLRTNFTCSGKEERAEISGIIILKTQH